MSDAAQLGMFVLAGVLVLVGLSMVTVLDDAPDGPQEFEVEEEVSGAPGDVDLAWWAGAGAVVAGVALAAWATFGRADGGMD